jgi:hypothetical protein
VPKLHAAAQHLLLFRYYGLLLDVWVRNAITHSIAFHTLIKEIKEKSPQSAVCVCGSLRDSVNRRKRISNFSLWIV